MIEILAGGLVCFFVYGFYYVLVYQICDFGVPLVKIATVNLCSFYEYGW